MNRPSIAQLPRALAHTALGLWQQATTAQRIYYAVGLLLMASGVFHLGVWLVLGGPWEGPLAWRKPILFGLSGGGTSLSIGWLVGALRGWRIDLTLAAVFGFAIVVEVGLITLQTWRGVPSHYNESTTLDMVIFHTMGWLIALVTVLIVLLMLRSWGPLAIRPTQRLAIRAGLLLLVVGCLLGVAVVNIGEANLLAGQSPTTYGEAGVLKFPHGIPLHSIQWLALAGWLIHWARLEDRQQWRLMIVAVLAQVGLLVFSLWQTGLGRGRVDVTWATGILLAVSLIAFVLPYLVPLWPTAWPKFSTTAKPVSAHD